MTYKELVECSLNGQFIQSLENYPGIIEDFRATYKAALAHVSSKRFTVTEFPHRGLSLLVSLLAPE